MIFGQHNFIDQTLNTLFASRHALLVEDRSFRKPQFGEILSQSAFIAVDGLSMLCYPTV